METTEKESPDEVSDVKPPEEFVEFKKPIFVGKIGRLPRKLATPEARETPQAVGSSGSQSIGKSQQNVVSSDNRSNDKIKNLTPALLMKEKSIPLPYKEPKWSGLPPPESGYCLEVLKGGIILETIDLTEKPFHVFGRLCMNDIVMAHPTISRHHAVLQYKARDTEDDRPRGFYLYDLGSSHGTFVNKIRLKANHYARVMVGHMLKLGCSTRQYILQGPEEDKEAESELSLTEMKQLRLARRLEMIKERQAGKPEGKETSKEDDGISWGMGEDAEDETDLSDNPFAVASNEELYLEDPKKTLRGYLEREGCTVEYDCQERGVGQFVCRVELPIEDARGRPVVAEVVHKGKKKDAVVQCALEACRIIDRHGLLRQAKHESRKRKEKKWTEDDYYDSDEDTFLDRTGSVERKREGRRQRGESAHTSKALTHTELVEKCTALKKDIVPLEARLTLLRAQGRPPETADKEDEDALDQFMRGLGRQSAADKAEISKTKMEIQKLKLELAKTERLAEIAKPADLPALVVQSSPATEAPSTPIVKKTSTSIIIGKRIKLKNREKTPYKVPKSADSINNEGEFVEEIDSDEEVFSNDREKSESISKNGDVLASEVRLCFKSKSEVEDPDGLAVLKGKNSKNKDVEISESEPKDKGGKTYGPMRPPSNYVVPASYYEQDTDRDLPEITDDSGEY